MLYWFGKIFIAPFFICFSGPGCSTHGGSGAKGKSSMCAITFLWQILWLWRPYAPEPSISWPGRGCFHPRSPVFSFGAYLFSLQGKKEAPGWDR